MSPLAIVPYGQCHCGCGGMTNLLHGKPQRFIRGHHSKKAPTCLTTRETRKRAYDRERYLENREEVLARVGQWQRANREKVNEISMRSKRRRRTGRSSEAERYAAILRNDPCCYCGFRENIEIDHIEPVSAGGAKEWHNLTSACRSCNAQKRTRSLLHFL